MKEQTVFITPATIHFYENLYCFTKSNKWFLTIKFENSPVFIHLNRIRIMLAHSAKESAELASILRHHFATNFIYEGSKVSVIYTSTDIIAIGVNDKNIYLDVRDGFKVKNFFELGLNITSLIIKF